LAGTHDYTQSMKMYILHIESYLMLVFVLHNQYAICSQSMASQTGQDRPYSKYILWMSSCRYIFWSTRVL